MDTVTTDHVSLAKQAVDALNIELNERNIGGGYNTISTPEYFQGKIDLVINWV